MAAEDLYRFLIRDCGATAYLPELRETGTEQGVVVKFISLFSSQVGLENTINLKSLQSMIKKAMNKRQKHILSKKNLTI